MIAVKLSPIVRYSVLRFLIFFGCVLALWLVGLRSAAHLPWLVVGAAVLSIIISTLALAPLRREYTEDLIARREAKAAGRPMPERRAADPEGDSAVEDREADAFGTDQGRTDQGEEPEEFR